MKKSFIPFALPDISAKAFDAVKKVIASGWLTTGKYTFDFEAAFARKTGSTFALGVNSGTAALHLALEAIGIQYNDLVITTPYTFTATAEVVRYMGADPVFVDIDPQTFNLSPSRVENWLKINCKISGKNCIHKQTKKIVKAIIPVHIGGLACDMQRFKDIAGRWHLKIVEDAAHALPCTCDGKMIGTIGDATAFSFYVTKPLCTGEGGMVTTNNKKIADRIKIMRLHGINRDIWNRYTSKKPQWFYQVVEPGFKYNITDVASAIGLEQLERVETLWKRRKKIAAYYLSELQEYDCVKLPCLPENNNDKHAWHLFMLRVPENRRDVFINTMAENGIGTSVHFIPLHIQPYYRKRYGLDKQSFPIAYSEFLKEVSLPVYSKMTDFQVEKVIKTVKKLIGCW